MSGPLRVVRDGAVVRVSLDHPPVNVLTRPLNRALATAVAAHAEDRDVTAIVIDGGASKGFSSGVEVADHTPHRVRGMLEDFHGAIRAVWNAECVTIAAVHGFALGGGLELALACDMIVADSDARLGLPEIALGCYPPVAAVVLPQRAGWSAASELLLTGDPVSAERAHALGLVNSVCDPGALKDETDALLGRLLTKSPTVLREAKRAMHLAAGEARSETLTRVEKRYLESLMALDDAEEGIRAFMEKRKPRFENR